MLDALEPLLTFNAGMYFATGKSPTRRGNAHPSIYPYETFEAADGWLNVGVANDKFWTLFCNAVGAPELLADPRFATAPLRVQHRADLRSRCSRQSSAGNRAPIGSRSSAGQACLSGAIRTVAEVCDSEQLLSRGMVVELEHPTAGKVRSIFSPLRFEDRDPTDNIPPPLLGEHTDEVLRTLAGMAPDEIEKLRAAGVIGARPDCNRAPHGRDGNSATKVTQ